MSELPHLAFHPFAIVSFIFVLLFASIVLRSKPDLPTFIAAMNSVGAQPTALVTLLIGCVMLILCKSYSLSTDIAAGIIGCGINMLTNQFSKVHTDATGKVSNDTVVPNTPTTLSSASNTQATTSTPEATNVTPSPSPTISSARSGGTD
jgi:hypothetical protein